MEKHIEGKTNEAFDMDLVISVENESTDSFQSKGVSNKGNLAAVKVSNVSKSYGANNLVLNDFSMEVESGTIFALLGASGCGKTTLMSCIVGLRKIDCGSIAVYGAKPGSYASGIPGPLVGYMPQETSLLEDFTIDETLHYFGRILEMTELKISERTKFLIDFLKLPKKDRYVKTLSGGQQRRVSIAVALLHSPKLLILDEPTVGVDPLLRQNIWDHLKQLVQSEGTTLIITTHYIGEAISADKVGLMRNGRILAQDSPENVLREHECATLDEVVLKLCLQDTAREVLDKGVFEEKPKSSRNSPSFSKTIAHLSESVTNSSVIDDEPFSQNTKKSFNRLKALVMKNFISLRRQFLFVFILLFLPAIQLAICCFAIGRNPSGIALGVVNNEIQLETTEPCFVATECPEKNLSCLFIDIFKKDESIKLIYYKTDKEALEAVTSGNTWGFFSFGRNFSQNFLQRQLDGVYAENKTIDGSLIPVHLDLSNYLMAISLQKSLFETFDKFTRNFIDSCGNNKYAAESVIAIQPPIYGSRTGEFTEFIAPGTLLSLIFFMAISLTGVVYITEKKSGIMERSLVSGVTPTEIILSHVISQYFIMIIQIIITVAILVQVFQVTIYGSFTSVILIVILQGTLGMFFGFLLSTTCKDEKMVLQMTQAITMPLFVLSGIIWPIESMPTVMKYISWGMPQTFASESIRSMVNRGWSLSHPAVWPGFVVTIGWILVLCFFTILFAKRQ